MVWLCFLKDKEILAGNGEVKQKRAGSKQSKIYKDNIGNSLVVQWLGLCLSLLRDQVQSLVRDGQKKKKNDNYYWG